MKLIPAIIITLFAAASLSVFGADKKEKDKDDVAHLVGSYKIVEGERDGQKIPDAHLKDMKVNIAANAITTLDKDSKELYVATYQVDATKKPWKITMTATIAPSAPEEKEGKAKAEGLIEIDGNQVKLIYALPGGKAPTEFKTDEKQQMFVLKKTAKQ